MSGSAAGCHQAAGLYADALAAMPETIDGQPPLPVDNICRVTLDEMLGEP
jgi:hypothetical protein